jgi:hypothetical protein
LESGTRELGGKQIREKGAKKIRDQVIKPARKSGIRDPPIALPH